jgi:predicted transcriptional regulator of viral defense system
MKNISFRSNTLLQHFLSVDKLCFSYDEAYKVLNDSSDSAVKELLRDIIRRGLLMRVKKGIYYIIPFEQDADKFMPDWHLLVSCLVSDVKYYIGYYSALQIHGLITQPSLHKMVVVNKQIRPSTMVVKNTTYQFIYHNEKHFFGVKKPGLIPTIKYYVQIWKRH